MKLLCTDKEFATYKSLQLVPLRCKYCNKTAYRTKHEIKAILNKTNKHSTGEFCSTSCQDRYQHPRIKMNCQQCQKLFYKRAGQIRKTKHHFCSQSCAATWNNTHKTKGTRVSKLEAWLATELLKLYPKLEFHFNRKDAINGELDIYIPTLKLAFELNGIFHYEPIYGPNKLASIKTNDHRKMLACAEHGIELCIIDVSGLTYFKECKAIKFLTIIRNIVDGRSVGT